MDGSKGLIKGIKKAFGDKALIQRFHWHKSENVVSYLPKKRQDTFRKRVRHALNKPTYEEAKDAIQRVREELAIINESAVRSLDEGIEEVLTLHKLGRSLKSTNCIESLFSQVRQNTEKVDYWRNSNQKQRWLASSLLDMEPRLNRISGYKYLPDLRRAIKKERKRLKGIQEEPAIIFDSVELRGFALPTCSVSGRVCVY